MYLLLIEMRWETDVVKKMQRKQILWLVDFYLELENIKIRHQAYAPLCYIV